MKPYGLPLDNRKTFTKLDWEVWTGTLSNDPRQFQDLLHRLVVWTDTTGSRVPTTDWYDTISGRQMGFQARSVVGGVFIKALLDPLIASKWNAAGKRRVRRARQRGYAFQSVLVFSRGLKTRPFTPMIYVGNCKRRRDATAPEKFQALATYSLSAG